MRAHIHDPQQSDVIVGSAEELVTHGFDHVVDPMIFRAAEIYSEGRPDDHDESRLRWSSISDNLNELIGFFDLLVFSDRLPMIDYGATFHPTLDSDGGFEASDLYEICNDGPAGHTLYSVHINDTTSIRRDAIDLLKAHRPAPNGSLAGRIAGELKTLDHQWRPDLSRIDADYNIPGLDSAQRAVDTFLYGGILFGMIAQHASAAHVIQGKRARLQLQAGLGDAETTSASAFEEDDLLFERLDQLFEAEAKKANVVATPLVPPVLPYLLGRYEPNNPRELIHFALQLRAEPMVEDLMAWRVKLVEDWRDGRVSNSTQRDLRRLSNAVNAHLTPWSPPGLTVSWIGYLLKAVPLQRLWNWTYANSTGNHLKLVMRLQFSAQERVRAGELYQSIGQSLQRVWSQG